MDSDGEAILLRFIDGTISIVDPDPNIPIQFKIAEVNQFLIFIFPREYVVSMEVFSYVNGEVVESV